jgi:predicted dehydrogenase
MTLSIDAPAVTARVGLVGAGAIGRAHAEAVAGLDGARLVAVADVDSAAARGVAEAHGGAVVDVAELAEPGRCDLVVVASPPSTHPEVVEPLLRANVPVLCEKPIATSLGAAQRLAACADATRTMLTMATKFRFVEEVQATRALVLDGSLGEVLRVEVDFAGRVDMTRRWNAQREIAGGGVLIDNATHAVDLVRYLVGDVTSVLAATGPPGQPLSVEDTATMLASTAGGALAHIDVTWSFNRMRPVYCAVYGSRGSVEISWTGARAVLGAGTEPIAFGSGYGKVASLRANVAAVLQAIAAGDEPPVTTQDAVAAAAVIDAGYRSIEQGGWVDVRADS